MKILFSERRGDAGTGSGKMAPKPKIPEWEYFEKRDSDPLSVFCTIPGCTKPKVQRGKVKNSLSTNGMGKLRFR